jgi:hypothetical protein
MYLCVCANSCYLKFCRTLNIETPLIDPSLYIVRFAGKVGGKHPPAFPSHDYRFFFLWRRLRRRRRGFPIYFDNTLRPLLVGLPSPCSFFAQMDLGNKTQVVATAALRLVAQMKRDWILTGRRPAGICAAALLIAARQNGFPRTQGEIVKVL